jgi:hypothetical protein
MALAQRVAARKRMGVVVRRLFGMTKLLSSLLAHAFSGRNAGHEIN